MADTAIRIKGIADIVVAGIVMVKPNWIYQSAVTRGLHSLTGLRLSDPSIAPGFSHSLACMAAAVGVGHVVASRAGKTTRPAIFSINLTWAILCLLTCLTPREWGLGNTTLLMSGLNHTLFSIGLLYKDPSLISCFGCGGVNGETDDKKTQ